MTKRGGGNFKKIFVCNGDVFQLLHVLCLKGDVFQLLHDPQPPGPDPATAGGSSGLLQHGDIQGN